VANIPYAEMVKAAKIPYATLAPTRFSEMLEKLSGGMKEASGMMGNFTGAVGMVKGAFDQFLAPMKALTGAIGSVPDFVKGVFDQAYDLVSMAPKFFKSIADQAASWVREFDPSAVMAMDQAMRSLTATVGYTLTPIVHGFTSAAREFAGAALDGMNALRPAVAQVVGVFRTALEPALHFFHRWLLGLADRLERAAPLLDRFGKALDYSLTAWAVFFEAYEAVSEALFDLAEATAPSTLLQFFTGLDALGVGLFKVGNHLPELTKGIIAATAASLFMADTLSRTFGGEGGRARKFLDRLAQEPQRSGRPGAAEGFGMSGLEEIYRKRLLEAAKSGSEDPTLKGISLMEDIRDFAGGMADQIGEGVDVGKELAKLLQQLIDRLPGGGNSVPEKLASSSPLWEALGWAAQQARNQLGVP